MQPLAPITAPIRWIALVCILVFTGIVVGSMIYHQIYREETDSS